MKTQQEIEVRLKEIEDDARLHYPLATIQINSVLALIQISLKAKAEGLRWILGLPAGKYHGERK